MENVSGQDQVALTEDQMEGARVQAAQRMQVQHGILKQMFADSEVGRIMAEQAVTRLSGQLEQAKATIIELTERLREAGKKKEEEEVTG